MTTATIIIFPSQKKKKKKDWRRDFLKNREYERTRCVIAWVATRSLKERRWKRRRHGGRDARIKTTGRNFLFPRCSRVLDSYFYYVPSGYQLETILRRGLKVWRSGRGFFPPFGDVRAGERKGKREERRG